MPALTCLLALTLTAADLPEVADLAYTADFEQGDAKEWLPYDNWGKPTLSLAEQSPIGHGRALRMAFDDQSTLEHFDKGFLLQLAQPIPWSQVDYIAARYHIDNTVANVRIFCHSDDGGWWDYSDGNVVIGKPAIALAHRDDFHLGWSDDPNKPAAGKTGKILAIFLSVHNTKPVRSGEKFVFDLDDVQVGAWLLPLPAVIRADAPPSLSWPVAKGECRVWVPIGPGAAGLTQTDTGFNLQVDAPESAPVQLNGSPVRGGWRTSEDGNPRRDRFNANLPRDALGTGATGPLSLRVGDATWEGRYHLVRALTPGEALGLCFRTGAASLRVDDKPVAGQIWGGMLRIPPKTANGFAHRLAAPDGHLLNLRSGLRAVPDAAEGIFFSVIPSEDTPPGTYRLKPLVAAAGDEVRVELPVEVLELDRQALLAAADKAELAADGLVSRLRAHDVEKWWAGEPPATTPAVRDRARVDPALWTRLKDPVTWADLGGGFTAGAQCGLDAASLKLYFEHYDFGTVIKPHLGHFLRDGWQKDLEEVARRKLLVTSIWGFVPEEKWNGGFGDATVPQAGHDQILQILGRGFLGYEMGEQDGRYIGAYAPKHRPATRAEARQLFFDWHEQGIVHPFHDYMVGLGSLNASHEYARMGLRMGGLETAQGLPSDTMEWAFLRGASKQWGFLPWNCISVWNRWGYKSYTDTGPDHGPDKGTSESLCRRLWYATWLYGSAINMMESAEFTAEKDAEGFAKLSPIGQTAVDGLKLARTHDRGVLYTPVALLIDKDAGWFPPRHLYTGARYLAWGNLPYSRGDDAIDAFFRWIWPQYEDCSYYPDERGFLCNTPFGDMFDVIESDATIECLRRYQAVICLGDVQFAPELTQALTAFVAGGGELVVDPAGAAALGSALTGVELTRKRQAGLYSVICDPASSVMLEQPYTYRVALPQGARALALSEHGDGLVWDHRAGQGRVITCAVPGYATAELTEPQPFYDVPLHRALLGAFCQVMKPYLQSLQLVRARTGECQLTVNVSADPNRLVVGLFNPAVKPVNVEAVAARGPFTKADAWVGEARLANGVLEASLPAGGMAVVEVHVAP